MSAHHNEISATIDRELSAWLAETWATEPTPEALTAMLTGVMAATLRFTMEHSGASVETAMQAISAGFGVLADQAEDWPRPSVQ